jgi:hypothetical protein
LRNQRPVWKIDIVYLYYLEVEPMTPAAVTFQINVVDGFRLGCLQVPLAEVADWLNFLVTPHYRADIISAEQVGDRLQIYFEANEGLYAYLENRLTGTLELAA